MKNTGKIIQYNKNKGYESISRDFLQDSSISYEARGLLAELQSYPENWKLYKTELYKRCRKNKRSCIERIWKELEEAGYLIQFRKRTGRKWEFQYIFSLEKFTEEDKANIDQELSKEGYAAYFSNVSTETVSKSCPVSVSSDASFQHPKKDVEKVSDADFQQLPEDCSETASKKLITEEINYKKDDDYLKGRPVQTVATEQINQPSSLSPFCQLLVNSALFTVKEANTVAKALTGHSIDSDMVDKQMELMQTTEIFNSVKYFINGMLHRSDNAAKLSGNRVADKIPLHNWTVAAAMA